MTAKKFLFISINAYSADLAWQLKRQGHSVKYYVKKQLDGDIGDGFVTKVENWQPWIKWADVIVFDDIRSGRLADKLRQEGKLVIGGGVYTDRLERDRVFGQQELHDAGVRILPQWEFTSYRSAIAFIKRHPSAYVIKPCGKGDDYHGSLYVGMEPDGHDVIRVLQGFERVFKERIKVFQLQKKVIGVEIAVGAFFNGHDFVYPINVNMEHKRMFPGDLGPQTGEMGTLMFWSKANYLFEETLFKMKPRLIESGYVGYIDIDCMADESGIYPLEFTSRFGYPTISIQMEGLTTPLGELFYRLARGEDFTFKAKQGFQIGLRVLVPAFPFHDKQVFDTFSRNSVISFNTNNLAGIHIEDTKLVQGQWKVAGHLGCALVVAAHGKTVPRAQAAAYATAKKIHIADMYYRNDIGNKWPAESKLLEKWGYLKQGSTSSPSRSTHAATSSNEGR